MDTNKSPDSKIQEEYPTPRLTRDAIVASVKKCMINKYADTYFKPNASKEQDIEDTLDILRGMSRIPVGLVFSPYWIGAQAWLEYAKTHVSLTSIQQFEKNLIRECQENPHTSTLGTTIWVHLDNRDKLLATDKQPIMMVIGIETTKETMMSLLTDIVQYEVPSSQQDYEDYDKLSTSMQTVAKSIAQSIQWRRADTPNGGFKEGMSIPSPNPRILVRYTMEGDFNETKGRIEVHVKIYRLEPGEGTDALLKVLN